MTWYFLFDEAHRRGYRESGHIGPGPQLYIYRVAVGRCVDRGLVEAPLGVREIRASSGPNLRLGGRQLGPRHRDRGLFAIDLPGQLLFYLCLVGHGGCQLAHQLRDVGLCLLQRKAIAGSARHQFLVLPNPQAHKFE